MTEEEKQQLKDEWCDECPIAENMRTVTYAVTNGLMSYANYRPEDIITVYEEEVTKTVEEVREEHTNLMLELVEKLGTLKTIVLRERASSSYIAEELEEIIESIEV